MRKMVSDFVPHWCLWVGCLIVLSGINALMILGHQSHNVVETNVPCKVVDVSNNKSIMILKMDCHGIVNTINGSSEVLAIVKSKIDTARCSIYENGSIGDCKPMGLD
jgi:hypothetical protein